MENRQRLCFGCDLKDDPKLMAEYKDYHTRVWPEIEKSLKDAGILDMEIYLVGNRLFLIVEVGPDFSWEKKMAMDAANPKVGKWETLMWGYQEALPWAEPGQKWVPMELVYKL